MFDICDVNYLHAVMLQVVFQCSAHLPSYDGVQLSGYVYFSSFPDNLVKAQLGQAKIPQGTL